MKNLEYVVYQTRDSIEPFAIAAFLERFEAEQYLDTVSRHTGLYQFYIQREY